MNPQDKKTQQLSEKEQAETNGGGLLGGDNNSSILSTSGMVNIHSSSTDEDGETRSNSFGGDFNSDSMFQNNED